MSLAAQSAFLSICVLASATGHKGAELGPAMVEDYSGLLSEVNAALTGRTGDDFSRRVGKQLKQTQADLAPLLATLTRDENDRFEPSAVKYALHHYFVRRFGWHVKGLDPAGDAWNSTLLSSTVALRSLPQSLQSTMKQSLDVVGLDAHDAAILALLLRHLIHEDGASRLTHVYASFELDTGFDLLGHPAALVVLKLLMSAFLLDKDVTKTEMMSVYIYPRWPQMEEMIGHVLDAEILAEHIDLHANVLGFDVLNNVREVVEEDLGTWQTSECTDEKQTLLSMEQAGTGRLTLSDFYKLGQKDFRFAEDVNWLRSLGALDETSKGNPRVIIANYMSGASNSLAATALHDIQCVSDCEALYAQLERNFVTPGVEPERLAAFVSQMPSASSPAPGVLTPVLLHRLEDIAAAHEGFVPVSGRMFAQWMHHVYPRDCPYPNVAGTTVQVDLQTKWKNNSGDPYVLTAGQMTGFIKNKTRRDAPVQMGFWDNKEELPARFEVLTLSHWVRLQFGVAVLVFSLTLTRLYHQFAGARRLVRGDSRNHKPFRV